MAARLDETAKGVFIIAATPFADDGALDLESADRLVDFYLESGVTGMTILGVLGEAPKLSGEESLAFARRAIARTGGRIPVVVGASNPGIDNLRRFSHEVMALGAAGVMVSPIPGLRTEDQVEGYIRAVVAALGPDVPVVLQDYPALTQTHMSVSVINRLFADLPSLKVLKHEDMPGLRKLTQVRAAEARGERRRISILVGNSALYLPQEMARGADGANTGFAFPEMLVGVVEKFHAGDATAAEDLYDAYLPLVRHEQQPGIGLAIRKEILRRRGVIASARVRAPGPVLDATDHQELTGLVRRLERRLAQLGLSTAPARLAAE